MTEAQAKEELRAWILARHGDTKPQVHDDSLLIEEGLLRSIDVVELIPYIEELRGRPVSPEDLGPGVFRSIDAISNAFFR